MDQATFRKKIAFTYCLLAYALMAYQLSKGMFLFQIRPFNVIVRNELLTNFFIAFNVQDIFFQRPSLFLVADLLFMMHPMVLYFTGNKKGYFRLITCMMLLVNFGYVILYYMFPTTTPHLSYGWILVPLIFLPYSSLGIQLVLKGIRYYFLFFFTSTGIWKLVNGGVLVKEQFSAILLSVRRDVIIIYDNWIADLIRWLIGHPPISYAIYVAVVVMELAYIIGFFTYRSDKFLIIFYLIFIVADHFLLGISFYWTIIYMISFMYANTPLQLGASTSKQDPRSPDRYPIC